MTYTVEFEGGILDGKKTSWRSQLVLFSNSLYITVFSGSLMIPQRYKYMGEVESITLEEVKKDGQSL